MPSSALVREYHESSDLFIFCGHGAGEKIFEDSNITQLRRFRNCPSALLWGCSSGQLRRHGVHDASGPALYYLLGGAACVLGNLWDVTDKDIDKLSMDCMARVLTESSSSNNSNSSNSSPATKSRKKKGVVSSTVVGACASKNNSSSNSVNSNSSKSKSSNSANNSDDHRSHMSLPAALSLSRGVCKMAYAVGAAPVVYGVPVTFDSL
jgi:hypothetical protein